MDTILPLKLGLLTFLSLELRVQKYKRIDMQALIEEAARYDQALSEKEKSILSAAEDLFAEKGASDTPTDEIAKRAGVTEREP